MPQLAMPLFVSVADVIQRMQLNADLPGITDVVSQAIMGAELQIEALLDGQITRKTHDCMYYLDSDAFSGIQPGNMFKLEVPSCFIRRDTPPTISYSSVTSFEQYGVLSNGFNDSDGPFGNFTSVDMSFVKIDYDRGYVYMAANRHGNRYIRLQCDTGFEPGTNTNSSNTVIPMEQIPQALYEAILSYVPTIFDSSQTTNRNQEAQPQYEKAADHARMLLKNYVKMNGFSFRPLWG